MNSNTINNLRRFQEKYIGVPRYLFPASLYDAFAVLDVGSMNVGCKWSGRDLWDYAGWQYTGIDIAPGPNVDRVVTEAGFRLGMEFDVVMSSGTLEHTKRFWNTFESMALHVKPGGYLFCIAPWSFPYHRFPTDSWRISPDGMATLCDDYGLQLLESYISPNYLHKERSLAGVWLNLWMRLRYRMRTEETVCIAKKPL